MENKSKLNNKILTFLMILLILIIFYPKKYLHGGPTGPDDENTRNPICIGISNSINIMPGLTTAVCYGILIK